MTSELRRTHRRAFQTLVIILPAVFGFALFARHSLPENSKLPDELLGPARFFGFIQCEWVNQFPEGKLRTRLLRERKDGGDFAVQFMAPKDFLQPDLLVYWAAAGDVTLRRLPTNSVILGAFGPNPLPLPTTMTNQAGAFVLYSLANEKIVSVSVQVKTP